MIPCQKCGQPSTTHLTHVSASGEQAQLHLCSACAEKENILEPPGQQLNIPSILKALIGANLGSWSDELSKLCCPACGIKYMEFRAAGRLGCPQDYQVFRSGLEGLLKRIHRAVRHQGKRPRRHRATMESHWEVIQLRNALRRAVDQEQYEEAAALRDRIRAKESQE